MHVLAVHVEFEKFVFVIHRPNYGHQNQENSDGEDGIERGEECDGEYWDCLCANEGKERL